MHLQSSSIRLDRPSVVDDGDVPARVVLVHPSMESLRRCRPTTAAAAWPCAFVSRCVSGPRRPPAGRLFPGRQGINIGSARPSGYTEKRFNEHPTNAYTGHRSVVYCQQRGSSLVVITKESFFTRKVWSLDIANLLHASPLVYF